MASNKFDNGMEHKQHRGGGHPVYSIGIDMRLYDLKRANKMAQAKMIWILCDLLGIPLSILGILANMDNIKSAVIALLGMIYLMVRLYFYVTKAKQDVRGKELDLWQKEMDKNDREEKRKTKK